MYDVSIENHIIQHEKFEAFIMNDNIFFIAFKPDVICDVADFEASVDAYVELGQGELLKVIAVFPSFTDITTDAREFLQHRERPAIAEAVVLHSLGQRIVFSFYQAFRSQEYPIKGFQTVEKALQWLEQY